MAVSVFEAPFKLVRNNQDFLPSTLKLFFPTKSFYFFNSYYYYYYYLNENNRFIFNRKRCMEIDSKELFHLFIPTSPSHSLTRPHNLVWHSLDFFLSYITKKKILLSK